MTHQGSIPFNVRKAHDYLLEVSRGSIPHTKDIAVSGATANLSLPQSTVWQGTTPWIPPAAPAVASIVSDDAADTALGLGARSVFVAGLDAEFLEQSEVLALAGLTPVASLLSYSRINSLTVLSAGADRRNAGIITATIGTLQRTIPAGFGADQDAIYSVPARDSLHLTSTYFGMSAPGNNPTGEAVGVLSVTLRLDTAEPTTVSGFFMSVALDGTTTDRATIIPPAPIRGPADVEVVIQDASGIDLGLAGGFRGVLASTLTNPHPGSGGQSPGGSPST